VRLKTPWVDLSGIYVVSPGYEVEKQNCLHAYIERQTTTPNARAWTWSNEYGCPSHEVRGRVYRNANLAFDTAYPGDFPDVDPLPLIGLSNSRTLSVDRLIVGDTAHLITCGCDVRKGGSARKVGLRWRGNMCC